MKTVQSQKLKSKGDIGLIMSNESMFLANQMAPISRLQSIVFLI